MQVSQLAFKVIPGLPLVEEGDDLVELIMRAAADCGAALDDGDVLVVAQKIVSKAEGRLRDLRDITPSSAALDLARVTAKDPRLVELILSESIDIVRHREGLIITRTRQGLVMANAGIDASNVPQSEGTETVLLLPVDADASAARIRAQIKGRTGAQAAVIISDSLGRPWREGTLGTAIGVSGLTALADLRGNVDLFGRELRVSQVATADALAATATLLMGEGDEGQPVVVVSGLAQQSEGTARDLVRPVEHVDEGVVSQGLQQMNIFDTRKGRADDILNVRVGMNRPDDTPIVAA